MSERSLPPATPDPAATRVLASALANVKGQSGHTYRSLAVRCHYSPAILNRATRGVVLPTWSVVDAFVTECGGDREQFRKLWNEAKYGPPEEPSPPVAGGRRRRLTLLAVLSAVVLLVAVVTAGVTYLALGDRSTEEVEPTSTCPSDTSMVVASGECIGYSDGSYAFPADFRLSPVLRQIKEQNERVVASGRPTVSFAYIMAAPRAPLDDYGRAHLAIIRSQLQGAVFAQLNANETARFGATPAIRILVVNVGAGAEFWGEAIPALIKQAQSANHLVGAFGLAADNAASTELTRVLTSAGIPMFPSAPTATSTSTGGVFQVSPAVDVLGAAAANYAKSHSGSILPIQDTDPLDTYGTTLADQFNRSYTPSSARVLAPELYDSSLPGAQNAFFQMTSSICEQQPDTVFFEGGGADLDAFLQSLSTRTCLAYPLTVITGPDGVQAVAMLRGNLSDTNPSIFSALSANVKLMYATPFHPAAWSLPRTDVSPAVTAQFLGNCDTCFAKLFPGGTLDDGVASLSYDSVLAPTACIRSAAQALDVDDYSGGLLRQLCLNLSSSPIPGATGPLSFDQRGEAPSKPTPIVSLSPNGQLDLVSDTP